MPKLKAGNRVCGKTKRHMGKIGIILRVLKESRQHTYEVRWTSGAVDIVSARSICVDPASSSAEFNIASDGSTFVELLRSADDIDQDVVECESSSSDDDEAEDAAAIDSAGNSEGEEDDTVTAHGRLWVPCDAILVDPASQFSSRATKFVWPTYLQLGELTLVKYFYLMYPMNTLQETLRITNTNLSTKAFRSIGPGDWFRWIGIRLAMAVEPRRGPTRVYWDTDEKEGYVNTAANYAARFQMSRHCFEQVMYALAFSDNSQTDDPWSPIRPLIEGFNNQRKKHISPGDMLVVDECMSAWKGREAKYTHDGLPHKTKIARKPEGKGTELNSLADGDSGVLLGLELVEGGARQRQKLYYSEFGEGTSIILRLVDNYKGTGRTVVADSAFASVKTLVQLEKNWVCISWAL